MSDEEAPPPTASADEETVAESNAQEQETALGEVDGAQADESEKTKNAEKDKHLDQDFLDFEIERKSVSTADSGSYRDDISVGAVEGTATVSKKTTEAPIELEADFFDQPEPDDKVKQETVETIEGMNEVEPGKKTPSTIAIAAQPEKSAETEQKGDAQEQVEAVEEQIGEPSPEEEQTPETRKLLTDETSKLAPTSLIKMTENLNVITEDTSRMTKISYDSEARIRGYDKRKKVNDESDDDLLGFMLDPEKVILFEEIAEEEEEVVTIKEEEKPMLDRIPFYARHDFALEEIDIRKKKNFILQKKLAIYYRRKKMEYVTKETDYSLDLHNKYNKKLEAYGDFLDFSNVETARSKDDIKRTKEQRADKFTELTVKFKKMQSREGEVGYGLINTKTGNTIPDKLVERLIHRQSTQMDQVCSMRLTFIKLKQMVQEKLEKIALLDEIAPGFLLADYEQLKSLNRGYADKIEEKDEELTKLRAKCASTIQILAHLREKSCALETDLDDLEEELKDTVLGYTEIRGKLNYSKQKKDEYRNNLNKLRDESGLLTQPTLLRDMETGLADFKTLTDELSVVMREYRRRAKQIQAIRKKIETAQENRRIGGLRTPSKLRAKSSLRTTDASIKTQIYRGRPSLMMPVIDSVVFDNLKAVKPRVTYDRRRYPVGIKHNKRAEG